MKSCACGGDMIAYGDGLLSCVHCDGSHRPTQCPDCLVYQRVTNARISS
jgi:hypothetical protein